MATTISNATLTVTLTESVSLNGIEQGATNTLTIANIDEVSKRIVSVPTSEVELVAFSIVDFVKGGLFTLHVIQIINGKTSLWGELIEG